MSGGILLKTIKSLHRLETDQQIVEALRNESNRLEITKSLLNLLYNICIEKSVAISRRLKPQFKLYEPLVLRLLQGVSHNLDRTTNVSAKKQLLVANPAFVRLLSQACPVKLAES